MSNRAQRRSSIRDFRKNAGPYLVTYMTDNLALIDGDPLLKSALAYWLAQCEARRPVCIGCRRGFMDDGVVPSVYLFAASPRIDGAVSTSAICTRCDQVLTDAEIDRIVTRVLRRLLPRGALEPLP